MAIPSTRRWIRRTAAALVAVFSLTLLPACQTSTSTDVFVDYGSYGSDFALSFSSDLPFRKAFSAEEGKAADTIVAELTKLGYAPTTQDFDENGQMAVRGGAVPTSRNIYVKIGGSGFSSTDPTSGVVSEFRRTILLCAHYDTKLGTADESAAPGFDGIQDNASGVASLMQAARILKMDRTGYDVTIVFLGASNTDQLGATVALASLKDTEIDALDAVYCVESIYAGDKLYANAGWNSLTAGSKYAMRKKLYESTDIALKYRIDLRTNQAGFEHDLLGTGEPVVLREVSTNRSDYSPFDAMGIPCVFFESFEFFGQSTAELIESKNPAFASTNGMIRGTAADSSDSLAAVIPAARLRTRINQVAFLLVKIVDRGADGGTAPVTPLVPKFPLRLQL